MDGSRTPSVISPDQSIRTLTRMRREPSLKTAHTTVFDVSTYRALKAKLTRQGSDVRRSAMELAAEAERVIVRDSLVRTKDLPWEDESGECKWGSWRVMIGRVLLSYQLEMALLIIIGFNVWLILYETNEEAKCYPQFSSRLEDCPTASSNSVFSEIANQSLLIIYSVEVAMGIFVLRLEYFKKRLHQFDFIISACGWCTLVAGGLIKVSWIRCFRVVRILKTLRFVYSIPEVYMLFSGFAGSMRAMFFGGIVLAALLCLFSILAVQLVHPINASITYPDCPQCAQGYQSVGEAMLTLFQQSVAGDSWGLMNIPILKESWVGMIMPVTHLVVGVGAMNLILAIVVDRAVEAREHDREQVAAIRSEMQKSRKLDLLKLFREFDKDESGTIDRDEVWHATESSAELKHRLLMLGLSAHELGEVFDALQDESFEGEGVGYLELCTAFDDLQAADIRKTVVLTKLHIAHMQRRVVRHLDQQDAVLEGMSRDLARLRKSEDTFPNPREKNPWLSGEHLPSATKSDSGTASFSQKLADSCSVRTKSLPNSRFSSPAPTLQIPDVPCPRAPSSNQSFESQTAIELTELRKRLAQLDNSWTHALRIAHDVSLMCLDAGMPASEEGNTMQTLCRRVLEKSRHRGNRLAKNLSKELEDDVATLARPCTSRVPDRQDAVAISVDHETVRSMPEPLPQPRSPCTSSPFVPERKWPQTPRSPHNRAGAVGNVNMNSSKPSSPRHMLGF